MGTFNNGSDHVVASTTVRSSSTHFTSNGQNNAHRRTHPRGLQILPSEDSNNRVGPILQCYHRPQWIWKVKHPRRHLLCPRSHKHVIRARFVTYHSVYKLVSFQMRAQNQQDLIYKRGQAGITKASVTIVFDNSDRANSPPGMENYAQITVTRQVRPSLPLANSLYPSLRCLAPC